LGSNLAKLDATTDEEIARQIAEDPDTAPELTDEQLAEAEVYEGDRFVRRVGRPKGSGTKELVTLRIDSDVLGHFRAGGPGWQTRLNNTLRVMTEGETALAKTQRIEEVRRSAARQHRRSAAGRPLRGSNAKMIEEVLQSVSPRALRPAEIRKALQDKRIEMAFTSIRRALSQLGKRAKASEPGGGNRSRRHRARA
jgi:uncharacterized protein (DUF4415 family)